MTIQQYIDTVAKRFASGISREHSYRADLENLLRALVANVEVTNEPANVTDCGNPDYVITKGKIPIGYIEAKDIAKDLNSKSYKEQFGRYKNALDNLIITDYLWFQFFQNGQLVHEIRIAEIVDGKVKALPENYDKFQNLIHDFCTFVSQTIKSSKKLAQLMAGKARLLQDILEQAVESDEVNQANTTLKDQYETFKDILIHDLKPKGFADIYAQTLAYGMFAARLNDDTIDTFSRQEAAELIPKSNPFLRKLFGYVAGPDIDERIKPTVENLAEVFRHTNVEELLKNFGKSTQTNDPIIHFYETFLAEYDPKLRKSRGVWYTPEPVVSFIVRAVDDILKTEFDLPQGLADTSKTKIKVEVQGKTQEQEVHKVQILDPATGTGTFLAEVVKYIYNTNFKQMQGMWSSYVEEHLVPRLNGFELLMASYAMAHLKLSMLLAETGYKPKSDQRLNVYLTNSLEEHHKDTGTIFSSWLSHESNEANRIKRDVPVMCVIGNPPYSGESANKGEWIMNLMYDYKKEPGGKEKLKEQNSKFINDDYVKFLRYGQYHIEKNGSGILGFINPHGFLDNPTFRGMRWNLLKTYDKIYTIDLHGNAKKKETTPDGGKDENVFDIQQGVSINLFIKTGQKKKNELGKVFHFDKYGKREEKYDFLFNNRIKDVPYKLLPNNEPMHFMVQKDFKLEEQFKSGIIIQELFNICSLGLLTKRDLLTIDFNENQLSKKIRFFLNTDYSVEHVCNHFGLNLKDKDKWNAEKTRKEVSITSIELNIKDIQYRPFDNRKVFYNSYFVARPNTKVLSHLNYKNYSLIVCRQGKAVGGDEWNVTFVSKNISDQNIYRRGGGTVFPLYLYPKEGEQQELGDGGNSRKPNLDMELVSEIAEDLGLEFRDIAPWDEEAPRPSGTPPREGNARGMEKDDGENSPPVEGWQRPGVDGVVKQSRSYKKYTELPYNPKLKQRAKELRKAGVLSEVLMWKQLKKSQVLGLDFDRQKIIGNYIVDFFNASLGLVIEIDGSSHDDKQEYDEQRQAFLEGLGLTVVRYQDREVKHNLDGVITNLTEICQELIDKSQPPRPTGTPPQEGDHPTSLREAPLQGGESRGVVEKHSPPVEGWISQNAKDGVVTYFTPIDILDYIYAVLHSPTYREKYKEFLKIDFPRVPYPTDKEQFWKLVDIGSEIRQLHLLETADNYITTYPIDGSNIVTRKMTKNSIGFELTNEQEQTGRVWINDEQYFEGVPLVAWEFYIGGYQPAQKWLKDRRDRELKFEDILHYQKIIVALTETDRLMKEVDSVGVEW